MLSDELYFTFCLQKVNSLITVLPFKSALLSLHLNMQCQVTASCTINTVNNRQLGRLRRRWEDNIKMGLQEVGYGGIDWIELAQDRDMWRTLMNAVMNLRVP
jgi:hypothetical protein